MTGVQTCALPILRGFLQGPESGTEGPCLLCASSQNARFRTVPRLGCGWGRAETAWPALLAGQARFLSLCCFIFSCPPLVRFPLRPRGQDSATAYCRDPGSASQSAVSQPAARAVVPAPSCFCRSLQPSLIACTAVGSSCWQQELLSWCQGQALHPSSSLKDHPEVEALSGHAWVACWVGIILQEAKQ